MNPLWLALVAFAGISVCAAEAVPEWIWNGPARHTPQSGWFRKNFTIREPVKRAELRGAGDFCALTIFLNGERIADIENFRPLFRLDVVRYLKPGENLIAVRAAGSPGPSAFFLELGLEPEGSSAPRTITDSSWLAANEEYRDWEKLSFDAANWPRVATFGPVAPQQRGELDIAITPLDNYEQWRQAIGTGLGTDPATFIVQPGFEIELLRSARPEEDSWIALAFDRQGRIIIAKEKRGLLRLTLNRGEDGSSPSPAATLQGRAVPAPMAQSAIRVEAIDDTLDEVRGLLFAHDSLYANANRSRGLFRLRATAGNGQFDEVKLLQQTRAGGHGRNDLALGPDGLIYMIHGDDVDLPPGTLKRTPPIVPDLLPGENLTHGHLIRADRDGKRWELVASGLRNPYGVDFNADGEAFSYDADAEHDMGAPWYRPTHVRHLVSGADFGWRRVTGRWPPYYPDHADNPPATLVIGKGSPTAVKFGTRSRFPPAYRRALFILDWAYGRILAVHLTPRGASYVARAETFLRGRPLNVTSLDFGPDGAMYFVTGGRNTQSGLYRVRYAGPPITEQPFSAQDMARSEHAAKARALRRQLESFHGRQDSRALETAWPFLGDPDPWIAHAARVAIEHQPPDTWTARALNEPSLAKALPALMALTRVGPEAALAPVLERLEKISLDALPVAQTLVALRATEIAWQRLGQMSPGLKDKFIAQWDALLPNRSPEVNREAAKLLIQLGAPGAISKTVSLLAVAPTQEDKLHYLFLLRSARTGWTEANRAKYFRSLAQSASFRGGAGLPKFLQQIKTEALAAVPELERPTYAALLESNRRVPAEISKPAESRSFVKEWTLADLVDSLAEVGHRRSFERGQAMFIAARCILCHQLGHVGRPVGPDLTEVASRFSRRDILESILEPSRVIADTYRNVIITTKQNEPVTGRVALEGDFRLEVLRVATDPFAPDKYTEIPKNSVVSYAESAVSPMPEGLLNLLTRDEILDLLAYLEAGGDSNHRNFRLAAP
ncbi:MAG: c-type cytochrome [Verrucomicrobia bacterium]|nr:c-type cytochrome [Verrucomicrobiota bacterium]